MNDITIILWITIALIAIIAIIIVKLHYKGDELEKDEEYSELCQEIKETIMKTADSRHFTVNWLPMRMFVNKHRYLWTNEKQYENTNCDLFNIIKKATNQDGFIEDLLPKGKSFNLQYNVATVAILQLLNDKGAEYSIEDNIKYYKLSFRLFG